MNETPDIQLAGLSIWALSRQFPESEDFWDGNWLDVIVRVEASGAFVEVRRPCLRTDEVEAFADQLTLLYRELRGTAELACIEPHVSVKMTCSPLGEVEVIVDLSPDNVTQSHRFVFAIDQSYVPATLAGCRKVLNRFPVKNPPNKLQEQSALMSAKGRMRPTLPIQKADVSGAPRQPLP
jgi:hypothetical protein